ncbi:disulfide bond formation protein B [Thalassorhabdomicrobium marinisediminis]|uniref:disulfide bond formation protein B n=1 Tax=Thalassorhabdomicrobium marinisediminis TaxID=2170577 RepID=UPI0024932A1E|nr:disulfide bond formation protein B [Thalassorhabdomicrobium marinisediminis]
MRKANLILLATLGSAALLGSAFIFQLLGYPPCKMCLWQRWPHGLAILAGAVALVRPASMRPLAWIGGLAALTTTGLGAYHTGVERGWWEGPSSCTGGGGLGTDLLSTDIAPIVMCDDVVWSLLGLSMASYNALFSALLAALWFTAARR